jgi:hypothetical protein
MAIQVGYVRNRNLKALTKNLPRIRLLNSVLGLSKFQIPGRYSVVGFTISEIRPHSWVRTNKLQ